MKNNYSLLLLLLFINIFFISFGSSMNQVTLDETTNYIFQWELIENDEILIILSANIKTWLGIGWGNEINGMSNADYAIGIFDNKGNLNMSDMVVTPTQKMNKPSYDTKVGGTNDILTSYGYQTSDYTYIKFTRKLVTGDLVGDRDLFVDGRMTTLIWARGSSQNLTYHGQNNRGEISIDLSGANKSVQVNNSKDVYLYWHISLMLGSFLVLMPFGIFVARYMRHYHYWFPLHYLLLGTAFTFSIVAFILAFMMTSDRKFSKHLLHAWFGLFTIILMCLVVIGGVMSHLLWKPDRKKTPIFPDIIHAFLARLTYLIALVSIWTGLNTFEIPKQFSIVLGFVVSLFFGLVIFLEIYRKRYPNSVGDHGFDKKEIKLQERNSSTVDSTININN
ncbi:carbohydrate-binding domain-containing protein [Dictyostelium discoideum AX4]|uniref:Ferric-chelate reductase fr1C n=1 Tax=Dictyostelium discoideum TaxID=44689 RepID=FR1C_DICDI|nr:carbohydrate-binding domain-containing protein [Dictyostelium discoideum AX4]EAL72492.1 carbohydrate-binding domain-containing protein [Dictyostelium discoideum AX4]|eukprot:XP_646678.1 carbohydrate-binding domain-containing protein [Dictyostelium discoideum AX4]